MQPVEDDGFQSPRLLNAPPCSDFSALDMATSNFTFDMPDISQQHGLTYPTREAFDESQGISTIVEAPFRYSYDSALTMSNTGAGSDVLVECHNPNDIANAFSELTQQSGDQANQDFQTISTGRCKDIICNIFFRVFNSVPRETMRR
jgi:hypothetical protein